MLCYAYECVNMPKSMLNAMMHEGKQDMRSMCSATLWYLNWAYHGSKEVQTVSIIALDAMQMRNKTPKENHTMQGGSMQHVFAKHAKLNKTMSK